MANHNKRTILLIPFIHLRKSIENQYYRFCAVQMQRLGANFMVLWVAKQLQGLPHKIFYSNTK